MIELIPAIDIINGECVRLSQGDYNKKSTYFKDPLEIAKQYEDVGIKRLHLVDLDGAKCAVPKNLAVLERIRSNTSLDIQYGGGIKSAEALESVFSSGANRAICGSIAVKSPEMFKTWLKQFGPSKIILGADIKDGYVSTNGWLENSTTSVYQLIDSFMESGLTQVICTDISKDGMLQGPSFDLYEELQSRYDVINVTVSGGISCTADIERLNDMNLRSVIIGKAIYEGHIKMEDLKRWLQRE